MQTKEELWEARRQKALDRGEGELSGEYDDEIDHDALGKTAAQNLGDDILDMPKSRRRLMGKGKVAPDMATIDDPLEIKHPDCPKGFDPDKWAKMSLEEKCKYLGISMEDWIRN